MSHLWKHRWPDPPYPDEPRGSRPLGWLRHLWASESWLLDVSILLLFLAGVGLVFWGISHG